jgi:NADH dehydrogenase (ubiquinone) Fe-S protein 3
MAARTSLTLLRSGLRLAPARSVVSTASRSIRSSAVAFQGKSRCQANQSLTSCLAAPQPGTSVPPFSEPVGHNPATTSAMAEQNTPLHEYGQYILTSLPKFIQQFSVYKDELTLYTAPSGVIPVLTFLRDHTQCQYKAVMDLSGVDYPSRSQRFEVSQILNCPY